MSATAPKPGPYDLGPFQDLVALSWAQPIQLFYGYWDEFLTIITDPEDPNYPTTLPRCPDGTPFTVPYNSYFTDFYLSLDGSIGIPANWQWNGKIVGETTGAELDFAGVCVTPLGSSGRWQSFGAYILTHGTTLYLVEEPVLAVEVYEPFGTLESYFGFSPTERYFYHYPPPPEPLSHADI